jgi:DNA invertase Pin-like site-specific DNA recombinase
VAEQTKIVIYTRYSTDMQRSDSCEDQEREVREALQHRGIDTRDALLLQDRAESGTRSDRDAFTTLTGMIERGEVQILAVDDQARLSRADNAAAFIGDLVYNGGRFISTGEGIDTDEEGWHLRVKIMEVHNSHTIRELARRVHRGQKGRVLEDGSAGDQPYGYESFFLDPQAVATGTRGPKPKKGLRICEDEAAWVRQVFTWFVDGMAIAAIARELTRMKAPKGNRASTTEWHHSQVRRMLCNQKYIGSWSWGTTKVVRNSQGKKKQAAVPRDQHVVRDRQELRIVDQETWEAAQRRLGELHEAFGSKDGQKRRGPRTHHTAMYPASLLGGLVKCRACGSRMHIQGTGARAYMLCPAHSKGTCGMAGHVRIPKAEDALLQFVADLLTVWPSWLEEATAAMRAAIEDAAQKLPESLKADESRLLESEQSIKSLIHQLVKLSSEGLPDSPAMRRELTDTEAQAAELRARVLEGRKFHAAAVTMPADNWIKEQLGNLAQNFREEPRRTALLLRRLLDRVTAESVVAPGKKRGFTRLRIRPRAYAVLKEALVDRIPSALLDTASNCVEEAAEVVLDLGGPTRRDQVAPEVARMRAEGKTWVEIGRVTGLGRGNACNVGKRWSDAHHADAARTA